MSRKCATHTDLGEGAVLVTKTSGINAECAICLELEMKHPIVLEGCKHAFCSKCLVRWQERMRYPYSSSDSTASIQANHNCPLCRPETTNVVDTLLTSARLSAERANRPGCSEEERVSFREQALGNVQRAMDADNPKVSAFVIKIDIILALMDGQAALDCIDELVQVNQDRNEKKLALDRIVDEAEAALVSNDENDEELMQTAIDKSQEMNFSILADDKESLFGIELRRAEAHQLL